MNRTNITFMNAALALSIVGLVTCCCVYTSFIFGALAILFACLSKGSQKTLPRTSKISIIIAVISFVIVGVMIVVSLASVISQYGSVRYYLEHFNEIYTQMINQDTL